MRSAVLACAALIAITVAVYMQTGNHQFLNFDDDVYVTNNPNVSSGITGKNIIWAFTSVDAANWHPLTWLSHMADVEFYGMNPRGHHITNVAIHSMSSLLLFLLLFRFTGSVWRSSFVAALFALHPLHVESVAWVAERKDVLSAFFWFLTLLCYCEYVAKQKPAFYIFSLFCFVLGLMSKPMLVTLPVVMLMVDYWPLERCKNDEREQDLYQRSATVIALVKEKIPFFACSLFASIITIYAQHKAGATKSLDLIPFILRTENALVAYVTYIIKTLWPHDLAVFYPLSFDIPYWKVMGSLLFLLIVSAAVMWAGRRYPPLAMGWSWFLVTLVPVIGLIQVGNQSMADRYSYIPVTGLFIMAAWGIPKLAKGLKYREGILSLLAGAVILASAAVTWQQLGYWRNSISLNRHALHVTSDNYVMHNNLGNALAEKGDMDAAIWEYREALRIKPGDTESHYNLGVALARKGDMDAAIQEYRVALRINPKYTRAHHNLGFALAEKGEMDAAIREFQIALRMAPDDSRMHYNLGLVFGKKGDMDAAIREFQAALRISPNDVDAHNNLGAALAEKGDLDAAIREYRAALRINPNYAYARNNLERALNRMRMKNGPK